MEKTGTLDRALINRLQKNFPLVARPYAAIAQEAGLSEEEVLSAFQAMKEDKTLSRIGAVVRPNTAGASSLVAMQVPVDRLEKVAAIVSAEPSVNHNYERENTLNLWFVVATSNEDDLNATIARLERQTGCRALKLKLEKAYHIDLGFNI